MIRRLLISFTICLLLTGVKAQTIKTGVLVIGHGNSAWAAGLQAAVSGVKTIILTDSSDFKITDPGLNIHSGIEQDFLKRMRVAKKISDHTQAVVFDQKTASQVLRQWGDSTKNLTIIKDTKFIKINRSGNNWTFKLKNGKTIKARILVNAGNAAVDAFVNLPKTPAEGPALFNYKNNEYRTAIGAGFYLKDRSSALSFLTFKAVLVKEENSLVLANVAGESMLIGQAAGAMAAYPAFFDTKTSEIKLKVIQGELLKYNLNLMPFTDVSPSDVNWKAMQVMGVMGVLKAEISAGKVLFLPENPVSVAEIEQPLEDLYYKAQIWFDDHVTAIVNVENAISLICYIGNKSVKSTSSEIEKKWKASFHFKSEYDLKHVLTRREFSVLLNEYLQPLIVNVDATGRVIR